MSKSFKRGFKNGLAAFAAFMKHDVDTEDYRNCPPWADEQQYNKGFDAGVDKQMAALDAKAERLDALAVAVEQVGFPNPGDFLRIDNGVAYFDIDRAADLWMAQGADVQMAKQLAGEMLKTLRAEAARRGVHLINRSELN